MGYSNSCPHCGAPVAPGANFCNNCGRVPTAASYPQYVPHPPPRSGPQPVMVCCIVGGIGGGLVLLLGILSALALPNYVRVKDKAKEAESKANLHNVQLSVERFCVDNEGAYPPYLIGGSSRHASIYAGGNSDAQFFTQIADAADPKLLADPLLRAGYMTEYPRNPFTRDGKAVHQLQENLLSSRDGADPLRNGEPAGTKYGTRFGPSCNLMGNTMADVRYAKLSASGLPDPRGQRTYSDIEYRFWDVWASDKPEPFLPGQFWYKSTGALTPKQAAASHKGPVASKYVETYMLGVIGGLRTKGKDAVGDEQPISVEGQPAYNWTRSTTSLDPAERGGSPFTPDGTQPACVGFGNPNAVRDGLVLVLTAGEDYIGGE